MPRLSLVKNNTSNINQIEQFMQVFQAPEFIAGLYVGKLLGGFTTNLQGTSTVGLSHQYANQTQTRKRPGRPAKQVA